MNLLIRYGSSYPELSQSSTVVSCHQGTSSRCFHTGRSFFLFAFFFLFSLLILQHWNNCWSSWVVFLMNILHESRKGSNLTCAFRFFVGGTSFHVAGAGLLGLYNIDNNYVCHQVGVRVKYMCGHVHVCSLIQMLVSAPSLANWRQSLRIWLPSP